MNDSKLYETVYIPISRGARMDLKILAAHKGVDVKRYVETIVTIEYNRLQKLNQNNGLQRELVRNESSQKKVNKGRRRA